MSLIEMSATGGALVLFIVVVRALAIHRLPKMTFWALWAVAALRLLLPFSVPLPFGISVPLPDRTGLAGAGGSPLPGEGLPPNAPSGAGAGPAAGQNAVLAGVWLAGALLLGLCFLISYVRCIRGFRTSLPEDAPYVREWLAEHRISRTIVVRSSDRISSPLTYGVLRPVILLPKTLDREDRAALGYVLAHEYVHIRRFDAVMKILFAAALCVHWFNPLVWVMYTLANRDLELSCDAWVIRMLGANNRSSYALTLIDLEERRSGGPSALCSYFGKNAITERIEAIMKFKKTSIPALILALTLVLGVTTAFAASAEPEAQGNPAPTTDKKGGEEAALVPPGAPDTAIPFDSDGATFALVPKDGVDMECGFDGEVEISLDDLERLPDGTIKIGVVSVVDDGESVTVQEKEGPISLGKLPNTEVEPEEEFSLPLLAVRHDDHSRFTPEEWADILKQIEEGTMYWED